MAYYDQYNSRNEAATYPPQQQYSDPTFNPYDNSQPHRSYEQAGYGYQDTGYGGYRDEPEQSGSAAPPQAKLEKESRTYGDSETFVNMTVREPKSARAMRRWRYEHQGNLWTAGSRVRCCGRFFCCTIMIFLFLLISIVLSLLLWIKPPNVDIGDVSLVTNGSSVQLENNGIAVNLQIPVSVNNPNYFSVTFDHINADIFYPINNTDIGGGHLEGLKIGSNAQTNFTLPFALNYTTNIDPNFNILSDLAQKCGFTGGAQSQITVQYELHLDFKILFIPIKPTIRNSASFSCPFSTKDLADLLKEAGINIPDLGSLLTSLF